MEYYLSIKKNEILTHAMTWMNSENIIPCLNKKGQITKHHILFDPIYMKCPEQKNLYRWKVY